MGATPQRTKLHCASIPKWNFFLLFLTFFAVGSLRSETLSFNNGGDFSNQFVRQAGTGGNQFEETDAIGIAGSRAISRSATGSEKVSYIRNISMGQLLSVGRLSLKFNYSTNSTGTGGEPLFFGITPNATFDGNWTSGGNADYIGVELSQRLTGSNESKLVLFNGVNGTRGDEADSAFENLSPGWYEIELTLEEVAGLLEMSAALHRLSADGSARVTSDVVTGAISSLSNDDLLSSSDLYLFLGGENSRNRGIEAMDEFSFTGFGVPVDLIAPSNLSAVSLSASEIKVAWKDNSNNETAFLVERRLEGGSWSQIAEIAGDSTNYTDSGLSADVTYFYQVRAANGGSQSEASNQASATTSTSGRPSVPENLVATAISGSRIDLDWTDTSNDETWFRIERREGTGNWIDLIDLTGNTTSHSDTGLLVDTVYTYRIRSGNAAGLSSPGNEASATTSTGSAINAPANLSAVAVSDREINLNWSDESNNEISFRVQRRQGTGSWAEIASLAPNTTTYLDSGLAQETSYSYRVLAAGDGVFSSPSNEVTATTQGEPPPSAPANLVASASSMSQIDLSWSDTSGNETGFRVERKTGNDSFTVLADLAANATTYSDTGLASNTTYLYRVRAVNAAGLSSPSSEAQATTPTQPVPEAPTQLQNVSQDFSKVSLAWIDNAGDEDGYRIQRKKGSNQFEQIADLPAGTTSFEDTDVTDYQTYVYYVYAYNEIGSSAFSNILTVDIPFFHPSNLAVQAISSNQVNLSWSDNSAVETSYRIQRRNGTGPWITIVNVGENVNSYSDLTVEPQTNYTYRVQGIRHSFSSEYTATVSLTTPAVQPPAAPSGLVIASQGQDHVVLQWNDSSANETGFRVERTTNGGGWETLVELGQEVFNYTDNQVTELASYEYRVIGFNDGGSSPSSNVVSTIIDFVHPTGLVATALSSERIDVTWQDNSSAEGNYRLERKSAQGNFESLAVLAAGSESYSDTDVDPLSTYTYRVTAFLEDLESLPSNEASATTPNIPAPGSATNLVAVLEGNSHIALSWTDNSLNESGFRLERMIGTGGWSQLNIAPPNTSSFQDSAIGELQSFAYRVTAFNDGGDASASNIASLQVPFNAPSDLEVLASGQNRIDMTWAENSSVESGYRVERKTGDGSFAELVVMEPNTGSYSDEGVVVDTTYTYRVIGLYEGGESTPTNEASAVTSSDTTAPAAPSGFAAVAQGFDSIQLSWTDNAGNESGFRIERKTGAEGSFGFVGPAGENATSWTDQNVEPDTTYVYRIASFIDGAQSSPVSPEASATTTPIPVPEAPSGLEIKSQTLSVVTLDWTDNSAVESGFKIQRKVDDGAFEELGATGPDTAFFNDTTVSEGHSYIYRIVAYNSQGESPASNEIEALLPLARPKALAGTAVSASEVELNWQDLSSIETGFRIDRKLDAEDWTSLAEVGANTTTYTDTGLVPDTTYSYRVVTVRFEDESLPGNAVNVTTQNITLPNAPSDLLIQELSKTSISVNWTDNADNEDGFRVYRKEASNGVWVKVADVQSDVSLYVDDNALPGVSYAYRVSAYNGGGEDTPVEKEFRIPIAGRLINISTRGLVETGDNVMIGSFIIRGDGPKTVLIRGMGPSLASSLSTKILADPELTLVSGVNLDRPLVYNDDWRDTDEASIITAGLPPAFDTESAIVIRLEPGAYSAILSGVNSTTGFGLIEVYEADFLKNTRMINISTRTFVQEGDKRMIGGFIIRGDMPARVFIRASGPSLPGSIPNRLLDPNLELYAGSERIDFNENWQDSDQIDDIIASGIPPGDLKESAIVATLEPGAYTAVVGGAGNTSGYSLLEIYDYPE